MRPLVSLALFATLLAAPAAGGAITPDQVLIVVNDRAPISERIAEYYRVARGIPKEHIARIQTDPHEEIDRATFKREIEQPIGAYLMEHRLQDQILVIVLTKGVPLKIRGPSSPTGKEASVDSELTLLYRVLLQGPIPPEGRLPNPYFQHGSPVPFSRAAYDIYLVTRLDGYAWEDIRGLIDRAGKPARHGKIVLDLKATLLPWGGTATGNSWLRNAAERLKETGLQVRLTESPATGETDVIGYAGWGSNDPAEKRRAPGFHWLPGAIASWFVSTSARTFVRPPPEWTIGPWKDPAAFYAGSPQSLIGDLIAEGVTGTVGFPYEPYLDGTARPDILFPAYCAGFTLAESFYMALAHLSWQAVVVGDPLVAPFGPSTGARPEPTQGISTFLKRRANVLETALRRASTPEATRALARVYAEQAKELAQGQHLDEALAVARRAVIVRPDEPAALYILGVIYLVRKERALAEEVFKVLIRTDPASPYAREAERWLGH